MRLARFLSALAVIVVISSANSSAAQTADPIAPYRARIEAVLDGFRVGGSFDFERERRQRSAGLVDPARGLETIVQNAKGETRARALMELGTVRRLSNDDQGAIAAQTEAAREAGALGLRNLAFDAWIGVARANESLADHGAAALAFDRAVDAAGEQPTEKQRADLAGYLAELEIGRGEFEAGVIDALLAVRLTRDPKDRFYWELDLAEGLRKLVFSCYYRPLRDAKSGEGGDDVYGACRRAVAATRAASEQAGSTAAGLGWTHLVDLARLQNRDLEQLIHMVASLTPQGLGKLFHPHSARDVRVNMPVAGGASLTATDIPGLAPQIEALAAEMKAQAGGRLDARSEYLLGLAKDYEQAPPEVAAQYFAAAAGMLAAERNGFFDPRRRGTAIEDRGDIIINLALRLLSLGREADAFAAFESVRARGLAELAGAMARPDISADDRRWLAELLVIEAKASATERKIVAGIVANGRLDAQADQLETLDRLRAERQAKLKANEVARARLDVGVATPAVTLDALRAASSRAGVPVLLYWTTDTNINVIAWYVGPDGSEVRQVVLPAIFLEEKVRNVLASSRDSYGTEPFDEATARELFLYLLAPFSERLNSASVHEIMIVPQGPLASLPFEALVDPNSGASVIDRWAVSYAPNATMAVAALQRQARPVRSVTALVDPTINVNTDEIANIEAAGIDLKTVNRSTLFDGSWRSDSLHVLMHGDFNPDEALLSTLAPSSGQPTRLDHGRRAGGAAARRGAPRGAQRLQGWTGGRPDFRGDLRFSMGAAGRRCRSDSAIALGCEPRQQRQMDGRVLSRGRRRLPGPPRCRSGDAGNAQVRTHASLLLGGHAGQRQVTIA